MSESSDDFGFKFPIGQYVVPMGIPAHTKTMFPRDDSRYLVLERLLQQCYGGIQRAYICRGITSDGAVSKEYIRFIEIELQASRPFDADPVEATQ